MSNYFRWVFNEGSLDVALLKKLQLKKGTQTEKIQRLVFCFVLFYFIFFNFLLISFLFICFLFISFLFFSFLFFLFSSFFFICLFIFLQKNKNASVFI